MRVFRRKYNLLAPLIGGCTCVAVALLVLALGANPHYMWRSVSLVCNLPPLWLAMLAWLVTSFLSGAVIGCILGGGACRFGGDCKRYKGGLYLVMSLTAGLMWYCLLFGGHSLFFSILLVAAACFCASVCGVVLIKEDLILSLGAFLAALWYLVIFLIQLKVIFCI